MPGGDLFSLVFSANKTRNIVQLAAIDVAEYRSDGFAFSETPLD